MQLMRSTRKTENPLRRLSETGVDPVRYTREILCSDPWPVQEEILRSVASNAQTAVKACHSSGKTRIAAAAVLWWITRYRDGIAVTTAPSWAQVQKLLWGEIHKAIGRSRFRWPMPTQTEVKLGAGNYATGLATDQGVKFQGFHSGHLLVVIDEAPGVEADIWEAIEGTRAGGEVHILALGNPTLAGGPFHTAFTSERELWRTISIDAFDTPNLEGFALDDLRKLPRGLPESDPVFQFTPRPYLVTRRWVYEKFWTWGEKSALWQARVRGQFPEQAEDALLSLAWIETASKREPYDDGSALHAGVDVAGPGEDETVCYVRCGSHLIGFEAWANPDPRGDVVAFLRPFRDRLETVNVDAIGIGYNFGLHLEDQGFPVQLINVGEASHDPEKYANAKAEFYWGLRERFEAGDVSGLTDETSMGQLATIRYKHTARGQVQIESKDDLRKRGAKSPDRAEALMLAYADRTPGIVAYYRDRAEKAQRAEQAGPGEELFAEVNDGADELIATYEKTRKKFEGEV
jgi:phage terminase large subunit